MSSQCSWAGGRVKGIMIAPSCSMLSCDLSVSLKENPDKKLREISLPS